jgi:hypothetical protein
MVTIRVMPCAVVAIFASSAVLAGTGSQFFFGLPHTPIGNATLGLDTPTGNLVVSNIGSSGEDGVSIDLDGATGFVAAVDIGPQGGLTPGTFFQIDGLEHLSGPAASGQDQKPFCLTITETNGGQAAVSVDVGFYNPTSLQVRALLGGVVVDTVQHVPPFPATIAEGDIGTSATGEHVVITLRSDESLASARLGGVEILQMDLSGGSVSISPSGPVIADELRVGFMSAPPIESVEMRGANVSEIRVSDEAVGHFGNRHRALGQAHLADPSLPLALSHCCLTVSNIGSSGDDGVEAECVPPAIQVDTNLPAVDGGAGFSLNYSAVVETSGAELLLVGSKVRELAAGPLELSVDFSSLGSTSQTVEVLLADTVIASLSGQTGPVGETTDNPECIIWDIADICAHSESKWDPPVVIDVNGLGPVTADGLRVTPEFIAGGSPTLESIPTFSLTGENINSFTITGETLVVTPPCPWDCGDDDGVVGIIDFLALLAGWGQPGPCDFDGDAQVGITDFLLLLANWGPCPEIG